MIAVAASRLGMVALSVPWADAHGYILPQLRCKLATNVAAVCSGRSAGVCNFLCKQSDRIGTVLFGTVRLLADTKDLSEKDASSYIIIDNLAAYGAIYMADKYPLLQ